MNIENPKTNIWAKLIALQPDTQNITLHTDKNEYLLFEDNAKIYKNQDGDTFIKNLSAPHLQIDDSLLPINQEKQLFGGEELGLNQNLKVDYVFCSVNFQSNFKRDRDRDREVSLESESLKKLTKVEADLQKELTCPICTNYFEKCMILIPCQHSFCSFCLFDLLKLSNKCPLCRVEAASVAKNSLLSNVVQLVKENVSILQQKSQNRKELEEISFGGTIDWDEEIVFIGSFVNGLKEGQGKIIYSDGEVYEGSWRNGEREGKGICIYDNGDKYDGDWMNGHCYGIGKYIFIDGREYEGNWQDDSRHGFGKMKYNDGKIYQGGWEYDEEEGNGILSFPNGDKYEGRWVRGILQSEVKIEYSNGEKYDGKIRDFKKQGEGTRILTNGDRYKGNWIDNVLQPHVTIDYSNGDQYEGEINVENLKKHGKGVLTFKNGDIYEGNWMNDIQHGQGKEIYRGGKRILEGIWEKGEITREVIMTNEDGKIYQVEMKKLETEGDKDALSENSEIDDDSKTQASDHADVNEDVNEDS